MVEAFLFLSLMTAEPLRQYTVPTTGRCQPYSELKKKLKNYFKETIRFRGISKQGVLMEVWTNPDTSVWTIVRVFPYNPRLACISGTGIYFHELKGLKGEDL